MFKKILSLLFCAILFLGFGIVKTVNAYEVDTRFTDEQKFLVSLGATAANEFSENDNVSRAAFASMAVALLNCPKQEAVTDVYTDVDASTKYAADILTAHSYGLVGIGFDRRFNPTNAIKANEVIKITVSLLGYESLAQINGGYPAGYCYEAAQLKISSSMSCAGDSAVTGKDAVSLLYKALTAPLMRQDGISSGSVDYSIDESRCILTDYFSLSKTEGIVTRTPNMSLNQNYNCSSGTMEINSKEYKENIEDCNRYFGKKVNAWIDSDECVRCVEIAKNVRSVTYDTDDIDSFSNNYFTCYTGEKREKLTLSPGYSYVRNGSLAVLTELEVSNNEGEFTFIDNDSDGNYDIVLGDIKKYMVVSQISASGQIYDKNRQAFANGNYVTFSPKNGHDFSLKMYGTEDTSVCDAELSDIKTGDILICYENSDGTFVRAEGSNKSVDAVVRGLEKDRIKLDESWYKMNNYFKKYYSSIQTGQSGTFYFACDGTITAFLAEGEGNMQYGYIINALYKKGLTKDLNVKLFTTSGKKEVYEVCDKVLLNDSNYSSSAEQIRNVFFNGDYPNYSMIKFSTDSNGKINRINTPTLAFDGRNPENIFNDDNANSFTQYMNKDKFWYKYYPKTAVGNFNFGSTVIMRVPDGIPDNPNTHYDENFFKLDTISYLEDDHKCLCDTFDYNESFVPSIVVLYDMAGGSEGDAVESTEYAWTTYMVDSALTALDSDGLKTEKLVLYDGKNYCTKYIDSNLVASFTANGKIPGPGDLIRISETQPGIINGIAIDADYNPATKKVTVNYGSNGLTESLTTNFSYLKGKAFSNTEDSLAIIADSIPDISILNPPYKNLFVLNASNSAAAFFDTDKGETYPGFVTDIKGIKTAGESEAQTVIVKLSSGAFSSVFVYD